MPASTKRGAGTALPPGVERGGVVAPREGLEASRQRALGQLRERREQVVAELTPAELAQEGACGGRRTRCLRCVTIRRHDGCLQLEPRLGQRAGHGVPHLPAAELAPVQVRRQAGRTVHGRVVALLRVLEEAARRRSR